MTDFGAAIFDVVRHLRGEPNTTLSKKDSPRWGTHGSLALDLVKGTWFDHENQVGGGVLDFVENEVPGVSGHAEAAAWLESVGLIKPDPTRGNGGNGGDRPTIVATYDYLDREGYLLQQIVRYHPKDFRQRHKKEGDSEWTWKKIPDEQQVPYHLPELLDAIDEEQTIYVTEGEKDCDALRQLGFTATTNAGGAGRWFAPLSNYFRGAGKVVICEHNDPEGRKRTQTVGAALQPIVGELLVMRFTELAEKGDVYNWLYPEGKPAQTAEDWQVHVALTAEPWEAWEPAEPVEPENKAGTPTIEPYSLIDMHEWVGDPPAQEWIIDKWLPIDNVTMLAGHGQTGKSTLMLQLGVAAVLGLDWLGTMPRQGPVLFVTCEENVGALWRRVHEILRFYNKPRPNEPPVTPGELMERGLGLISLVGRDQATFVTNRRTGLVEPTNVWKGIVARAEAMKGLGLFMLDPMMNLFAGNHNDPVEVTQVINFQIKLAVERHCAGMFAVHLTKTAMREGDTYGNTVAWYNAVRSAMLFKKPKPITLEGLEAPPIDETLRVLEHTKWQYSAQAEQLSLQWVNHLFRPLGSPGTFDTAIRHAEMDALTLELIRQAKLQGETMIASRGHASTRMARMLASSGHKTKATKIDFLQSIERLLGKGIIRVWDEADRTTRGRGRKILIIIEYGGNPPLSE